MKLGKDYWESRWKEAQTGWDIGTVSTPLARYFDQLEDKDQRILIPGCGNAWEGEYLHDQGFTNVFLQDIAPSALENFKKRVPSFPEEHLLHGDFFDLEPSFDLMIEQTFFCALQPDLRSKYVDKASSILNPKGKLTGLLFNLDFGNDHPPFGGSKNVYEPLFKEKFEIQVMEPSYNSIGPRAQSELFIKLIKL